MRGKSHIRGALTTGSKWHFIVVDIDDDGDGAKYWVSEMIEWKAKLGPSTGRLVTATSDESDPALIAGILSSWVSTQDSKSSVIWVDKAIGRCSQIQQSFERFEGDQWFVMRPGGGGL